MHFVRFLHVGGRVESLRECPCMRCKIEVCKEISPCGQQNQEPADQCDGVQLEMDTRCKTAICKAISPCGQQNPEPAE